MSDMTRYYAHLIEQVFYLKENQGLTREQINEKICDVLEEMRLQQAKASRKKALKDVKKALTGIN